MTASTNSGHRPFHQSQQHETESDRQGDDERQLRDHLSGFRALGRSKPNEGHVISLWEREDEATAGCLSLLPPA